jgi:flagellar protein FlaG
MIYITRPVNETHKTVPSTKEKTLDNNMQERKPQKPIIIETNPERHGYKDNREELDKAVENTNRVIFKDNEKFEFRVHERTGRLMVKLVNTETDEIIKEIPPEKILDLVASIWDLVGILVDERG